ncbi:MAG: hypothetical protein LUI60_03590, partial [Clostridia bacterium]|nr:hypothetical protein [Clostridia bacterium]
GIYRNNNNSYINIDDLEDKSVENVARSVSENYNNGILNIEKIQAMVEKAIEKSLSQVLGVDIQEKINNQYSYYRNVYHFGLEFILNESRTKEYFYAPLYNKTVAETWHIVGNSFAHLQFQYEIIDQINPILLNVPFESQEDNQVLKRLRQLPEVDFDHRFDNINLTLNTDDTDWREAMRKRNGSSKTIPCKDDAEIKQDNDYYYEKFYETAMKRLNKIVHYNPMFNAYMGEELYIFLTNNKQSMSSPKMHRDIVSICNKITSLSDIIDIIAD